MFFLSSAATGMTTRRVAGVSTTCYSSLPYAVDLGGSGRPAGRPGAEVWDHRADPLQSKAKRCYPSVSATLRGCLFTMLQSMTIYERPFVGNETLIPGDRGRKKLAQRPSEEMVFRPIQRPLYPLPSGDDTTTAHGKRCIRPKPAEEFVRAEQRHNLPAYTRSGYDAAEGQPFPHRASVEWPGKAKNARDYISGERILEVECGMKGRVNSRAQLRNGIEQINPGDKAYAHVDYSPNFFLQEGLIPGSCIQTRRTPKAMAALQTLPNDTSNGVNFRPFKSYEQDKREREHSADVAGVRELDVWDPNGPRED